ncbi:MAG: hypothetical protein Q9164_005228 [Protoblastenia rupestris]
MTTGNVQVPETVPQAQPPSPSHNAASPPSKRDLASWWNGFKKKTKKEEDRLEPPTGIFGVSLATSIKYANVAISLTNENGESYIYGYVPIIIAKCGVFLKEKGTDVHGIFRLPGSAKRIKELQAVFDSPDRYGKGLDWTGYTVHDAGSIFRRYINALPEPVIPLNFYEQYRAPIRDHQKVATDDPDAPPDPRPAEEFDHSAAITTYQKLITELPPLNRQLLLYLLDLLAVFASKHEVNGMDSFNLSAVFQPGMLSHPKHDLFPPEYKLSQNVLVYLIMNQDHFLVGMEGTQADEKTVKDVQSGVQRQPQTPTKATHAGLGRSASNASAGTDSLRKAGALRRNASVSSRNSNISGNPSPGTPAPSSPFATSTNGAGVYRSNTLPSKKSPGLNSPRSVKVAPTEVSTLASGRRSPTAGLTPTAEATTPKVEPVQTGIEAGSSLGASPMALIPERTAASPSEHTSSRNVSREIPSNETIRLKTPERGVTTTITSGTPTKDRKLIFSKSPSSDTERKDTRQPNKLKKKTRPSELANNRSAQSSTHSLHGLSENAGDGQAAIPSPSALPLTANDLTPVPVPTLLNTEGPSPGGAPPRLGEFDKLSSFHVSHHSGSQPVSPAVKPAKSPVPSVHSNLGTEESEAEQTGSGATEKGTKRRSRWRLSTALKKDQEPSTIATQVNLRLGSSAVAEESVTSMSSPESRARKSGTYDSQQTATTAESSGPPAVAVSSEDSTPSKDKEANKEKEIEGDSKERRGLFGRIKDKVTHAKEERKEKEAEKERAKSPTRKTSEHATSKQSLAAIVSEPSTGAQPSEAKVGETQGKPAERQ